MDLAGIESKEEESGRRKVAVDMGVGTGLVLFSFPRPYLLCLKALEAFLEGFRAFPFQSCRPALALSPHDCYHLSVWRLGLAPASTSRGLAQCWS